MRTVVAVLAFTLTVSVLAVAQQSPQVWLLKIDGEIGRGTVSFLRKGLSAASESGAHAAVIEFATPGGYLDAAVAREQEMTALVQERRAAVVEAEAEIPRAIAEAFRKGQLGVMDYYNLRNIQADTKMREGLAEGEEPPASGHGEAPPRRGA